MSDASGKPGVKEIFLIARGKENDAEREKYLKQVVGDNEAIRKRVECLLNADQLAATNPLDAAVAAFEQPGVDDLGKFLSELPERRQIGPYKVLHPLGEGGMGQVYAAEQFKPVQRVVAIKLVKRGMDSKEVLARFDAERQAMAMMNHPNIARIIEADQTDDGLPYFVMDLVRGIPITEYSEQHQLRISERLELFQTVCDAVQHAHQKGLIHRDLKPSNILVERHDVRHVPKIIDFGVAKATNQRLTQQTLYTHFSHILGTPLYMSPEQAELSGLDVDTRSDVYSLGVVLYELITGTTPFDRDTLRNVGFDEMRRIIREDDPPRPSHRASTLNTAKGSTVDGRPHFRLDRTRELLGGELDWIVMKALEKDRTRRYESASALAADIGRYLQDEPVEACPPSLQYRLGKISRRYKGILTTAATVLIALLAGTGIATWQAVIADAAAKQAEEERAEAEHNMIGAMDAAEHLLANVSNPKLANIPGFQETWASILEDAVDFYDRFKANSGSSPEVDYRAAKVFLQFGHLLTATNPNSEGVIRNYKRGLELAQAIVIENPKRDDFRALMAELHLGCADYYWLAPAIASAEFNAMTEKHFQKAQQEYAHLELENPDNQEYREMLGIVFARMARFYNSRSPNDPREQEFLKRAWERGYVSYRAGARLAREAGDRELEAQCWRKEIALLRDDPDNYGSDLRRYRGGNPLSWATNAARVLVEESPKEAEWILQETIKINHRFLKAFPSHQARRATYDKASMEYSNFLIHQERRDNSLQKLDALVVSIPAFHNVRALVLAKLGSVEKRLADFDESLRRYPTHGQYYFERAAIFQKLGNMEAALADLNQLLDIDKNHRIGYQSRAVVHFELRQYEDALADLNVAQKLRPEDYSVLTCIAPENVAACPDADFRNGVLQLADRAVQSTNTAAGGLIHRGFLLVSLGRSERAAKDFEKAIQQVSDNPALINSVAWRIITMRELESEWIRRAVAFAEKAVSLKPDYSTYWNTLGVAQYRAGDYKAATTSLDKSVELGDGSEFGYDGIFLAMAHWQLGNKDLGLKLYDQSLTWRDQNVTSEALDRFYAEAEELFEAEAASEQESAGE